MSLVNLDFYRINRSRAAFFLKNCFVKMQGQNLNGQHFEYLTVIAFIK